eukprot:4345666-Pleurochrysis_carterae.AAC.1
MYTLKLRARAIGGTIVVYLVELPGLGKSGGRIEQPKLTQVLLLAARQSGHRLSLSVPKARRVRPRLLVTARLGRLGHRTA